MSAAPAAGSDKRAHVSSPRTAASAFWASFRSNVLLGAACLALVLLAAVICYDVVCRYLLSAPSRWGYELSSYLMAVVVLFGAAHTLSVGAHIRVDIIYEQLAGTRRAFADMLAWLAGALFSAALTWLACQLAWRSYSNNAHSMDLGIPLALPQSLVAIGALALLIESLMLLAGSARRLWRNRE